MRIEETKEKLRNIALNSAKTILSDAGIEKDDKDYAHRLYNLQIKIYNELKVCFNLPTE